MFIILIYTKKVNRNKYAIKRYWPFQVNHNLFIYEDGGEIVSSESECVAH